jgi:hypothetical protein
LGQQSFGSFRAWAATNAAWVFLGTELVFLGIRLVEHSDIGVFPSVKFIIFEIIAQAILFFGLFFRVRFMFVFTILIYLIVIYALADEIFVGVGAVQLKSFFIVLQLFFLVVVVEGLRHLNREVKLRMQDTSVHTEKLSE